ncbi:uncharacterized protein EKO05_0011345 [Ascochyta rabiei]|uniref:Uncharacterized protein n=1 Tax=Didymella rabiei TaxID=5454 RepID=A0A163C6G1_DIDRA|nr:uncharacterized protein EKO05_0011345 [Ascochyta rabiei]KZM22235.1 hypothetical protein ST47_g6602 [Ascochyta rabiei]UPX21145.1 hypothetical protein EKO05_0011345 [Ascochyta rabiei]
MSGPIASAVVLPAPDEAPLPPASPSNTLKRRQSSVTEDRVKRIRASGDHAADESTPAAPRRRERGRERRLFGAVLGALSQAPTTAGQKRRAEMEKRQQARRRQEDEEAELQKAERLARRSAQRWKEQKHFERQAMRVRHDNMLQLAHFLCTNAEPRLHYRPWETSAEEQDRIDAQIADARHVIQRERDEYEDRQEEERRREQRTAVDQDAIHGGAAPPSTTNYNTDAGRSHLSRNRATAAREDLEIKDDQGARAADRAVEAQHAEERAMDTRSLEAEANADDPSKEADEEVVEAAEDTVIY